MNKLYLLPLFLLCCFMSFGQTKGLIYKPASTAAGRAVLDPNGDGYTSKTAAGFKTNDRGNGESEIAYKAIPILENEPIQDPLRGPGCGFTDMVDSGVGDPVMFYFDGTNFLVRFRLNKTSPNSKGYSVLIDTDQKFGFTGPNADPNAVAGNPGFEMELVLMSNHGVALYNINGTTTPTLISNQDYDSHAQKSIAYTEQCGDMDYFYDFYMPWSAFGLPVDTKLRMVALTVMNPKPSMGNNAKSDVGGVDDRKYGGNYDKLFEDFIQNYNPTSPQDNNSGISARTLCPSIDANVTVTSTSITGTSTEAAGTAITVYKNGVAYGTKAYVTASGTWSFSVSGLAEGDVITASAKATNKEESESNCSGVLVGQVCTRPAAPTLSGSNGNSNKYVTISSTVSGVFNLYLGSQLLVANANIVAGTTYYYCPAAGLVTAANSCNGGNNLAAGVYRATLTVGGCTSNSSFLCVNTSTASATPTINSPITTATKYITGTAVANAQVILKVNGAEKVRLTASATGAWSVPTSSLALASGNTITAYALEDGKCQSAETAAITVTQPVSIAPSITGTYCGTATVITGTSAEAAGTTIRLFLNGSATALATTTTGANGNWSITGVSVTPGSSLTAKATAAGKTESAASVAVSVKSTSSNSGIIINSTTDPATSEKYIMESATSISGTAPGGSGIISLYLDEMFIGSGTLSGGNWTVTKASFPNDFYLFAGATLTATFTATGGCESDFTLPTVAIRCAPPADKAVTPTSTVECTGATPQVTISASEAFLIYQLFNGSTPISSSVLGNGSNIVLNTTTPLTATAANTLVNLRVVASKIPYVQGVNCDKEMTQQVAVTLNPVIENNTISLPSGGGSYCGPTSVGAITGSTPTGGNGTYTYQWQSNASGTWADISGATGKDYNPGQVSTTTSYRRKVFSAACSNEDASASVEVKILAAIANNVSYSGQAVFCGSGTPGQLQGNTDGSFTSYQWQYSLDGSMFQNIAGANSANYTPGNLTQTTTFRRVVSNGTCESYSANITITVNPAIANNTITAPATTIFCAAGSLGEITGATPTGGNGAYTYKWQISTDNGVSYTDISPAVTTPNYTPANVSATTYFKRLVSSGACANAESNVVKITVVSVAQTTVSADATTLAANGTSTTTIRVQLKDAFGADVNTAACNLTLNADKGTISNLVNVGDGTYTATYTSGTISGLATITGVLNGSNLTNTAQITLNPALNLAATTITASPTTVYANGSSTSTATVRFKDYAGNAITVDAAKVSILLNNAGTSINDLGNGAFTAVVPAQTSPSTVTVTAKYDGAATGGSATVNFIAEPVVVPNPSMANSTVTASPTTVNADNVSTSTASVQFKDASGDNLAVDATKVDIFLDGVSVSYTDKGNGLFEVIVPARTTAATVTVTARYDGAAVNSSATVNFVPVVNPALTVVSASPATVNANGSSTATVTVTYKDYAGNPIAVAPADASILLNGSPVSVTANGTGVYTATVPARTTAETVNATATYKGTTVSSTASIAFVAALNLAATEVTASPVTVNADGTSTSTASVSFKDYAGNAIAVETAKVKLLLNNVSVAIVADGTGVYKATVPARIVAETVHVTAQYDATTVTDDATVTFVAALNLAATEVTATPNQVAANGSSTATAKVVFKDYNGNPIAVDGAKVRLLLDGIAASITPASAGTYIATVPARTTAATVTVTATYEGAATGGNPTVQFVPVLNLAATTLVANPAIVNANGTSTSTATLRFYDYAGNAIVVDAAKVTMLMDGTGATITSLGNGVFELTVPATTTAKTVQVTAKYDGATLGATATVEFVATLNLAATEVTANPTTVNADGTSTSTARVAFKDYAGNSFAVDISKVELLEGGAVLAGLQDKGNGVFEATVPARITAETASITAKYNDSPTAGSASVNFVAVVDLAKTTIQANPTTVAANGTSTSEVTITFRDHAGNNIAIDPAKLNVLLNGTGVAFTSGATGVYTATVPARTTAETVVASATYNATAITATASVNFVAALNLAATEVTANPTTVNADGASTSTARVAFKDYAGNAFAVDPAKVKLFEDAVILAGLTDKGNGIFEATIPARTNAATVEITATYDGASITDKANVNFVPALNLAATEITATPTTVPANGISTSEAIIRFKDYAGNGMEVDPAKLNLLLNNITATFQSLGGGAYKVIVPARTTAENVTVTAKYDGAAISSSATVTFVPVVNLAATTLQAAPATVAANGTSTANATLQFKDYAGNAITVDAAKVAILLDGVAASVTPNGTGVFELIVPARTNAQVVQVTATYDAASVASTESVTFVPAVDLSKTVVSASPATVNADGVSTATATVVFKDYAGNNIDVNQADVALLLNGTSNTVTRSATGTYTLTIPARTTAETVQVTATYSGSSVGGTATVNFVPVVNLAATTLTATPGVVVADGTSTATVTLQFKDYAGNAIAMDDSKVVILLDGVAVSIDPVSAGKYTTTVPARTTVALVTATATYDGAALSPSATVEFTPVINVAATLVSANPTTVNADGVSTSLATVEFKDMAGNAINVDASKVSILLNGTPVTATAKGNGVFEATIPARTIAETVEVTAKYDGEMATNKANVSFVPALNLAATTVTANPLTVNADGTSTATGKVSFKDYAGNAFEVEASKVELMLNGVAAVATAKGNGVYEVEIPARTVAEQVEVTAKYNGSLVSSKATVAFVPALNLATTTIVANPTTVNADGTSISTATITFRDYAGNPIAVEAAKLDVKLNGVPTTFTAGSTGVYTAIVPARTTAETVEVTGVYDGEAIAAKASVTFIPAVNLAATIVSATPASLLANGVSTAMAKVEFKDYAGNAITVDPAKVAILLNGVVATLTDKGNGVFEAVVPARNTAAVVEVTATYDGTTVTSKAQVEFIHVPALSLQRSTVVANPTTVVANGTSASLITVQLKDGDGNNFSTTETVSITSDFGTVSAVTNNGNGNYTATIASASIGTATITAKVGTATLDAKPTVNFVIGSASATTSTIVASKASIPADGASTSVITVTLFDAQNRRITTGGDIVTLSSSLGTLGTVTDNNDGTYTATLTSATTAGNAIVSGKVNGANMSNSVTVTFTALPIPNRAPIAQNDQFTVNNHEKLTGNVLANDSDPDGNPLTVKTSLVRQPMFGTVVMQANGTFTYTPNKGYAGTDSFTYEVCDNGNPALCAQATVNIQVVQSQVFIPEGFSPDGDGENDTFVIYGAEKYKVSLKVFNRWGDVVYESKVYKNDWDGTAQKGLVLGDKLPDGTYFYIVDLNNGEKPRTHSLIIKRK